LERVSAIFFSSSINNILISSIIIVTGNERMVSTV
jgi:hypothetical protein